MTLSSATPVPGAFAIATFPFLYTSKIPGIPIIESGLKTVESKKVSSMRR